MTQSKGIDIFRQVQEFTNFNNGKVLDVKNKLFSIATDTSPAIEGKNVGFVKLTENELSRSLLLFPCVRHEENLLQKQQFKDLMILRS